MRKSASPKTGSAPLLMAGILCFGGGSAYFALQQNRSPEQVPAAVAVAAEPARVVPVVVAAESAPPALAHTEPTEPVLEPTVEPPPVPKPAPKSAPKPAPKPASKPAPKPASKPAEPVKASHAPAPSAVLPPPVARPAPGPASSVPPKPPVAVASPPPTPHPPAPSVGMAGVRATTAMALVPPKPVVVLATVDKAWVRLDERRTVIVSKGEALPGLGKLLETSGTTVKFENATLPIITE